MRIFGKFGENIGKLQKNIRKYAKKKLDSKTFMFE